ncbi:Flp pilus assembly protein CpaB [Pseudomonas sp. JQ170]|uniref:Flp pilus assembly protein CpaB n=1 Tax=unclassified Pseudomonas TaxID=196821 RepID=UPI0026530287|nr:MULTISPECIES: Flp pilus assembly protein CpaB [unclassified Pseudomonas]MDN7140173.1 Flp pilus assembly protein CpaB [Pseudomonas sp. JQ170]WRO76637.1 Flp pilus assembly protein CpaB [Pseudomonas sp. 170C]
MGSRLTIILAGFFLLGALLAGYWGLELSRPAQAPVAAPVAAPVVEQVVTSATDEMRQPVVVLRRDVAPYTPLTADDLLLERLQVAPAGSFQTFEQVLGRSSWRALSAGTWLEQGSFDAGGPLARMIHPHERALAVAVDEVIGAAGQLSPGDYVDVLLYLREANQNPQATAQVVLPALRVLSVGAQMGLGNDGRAVTPPQDEKARQDAQRNAARTVVLAVPEKLASRLMLATQTGSLRLAVRSAEEKRLAQYWANPQGSTVEVDNANRELYRFSQLAQAPVPQAVASTSPRRGMEIIRGNQSLQPTP